KNSSKGNGKNSTRQINQGIIIKFLNKVEEFFEWFGTHHPRRKAEIDETLYKLEGSELRLPPALQKLNVDYWDEIRDYFQAIAHHRKETNIEEFKSFLAALERFLLDRLFPRTFADFEEIDEIIREGESGG